MSQFDVSGGEVVVETNTYPTFPKPDHGYACPAAPVTGDGWIVSNVVDFGCDPTGVEDCRLIVRAMIDTAPEPGRIIYFPPGVYRFDSWIRMRSNIILQGDGPESILQLGNPDELLVVWGGAPGDVVRNTAVRDLQFRGFPQQSSSGLLVIAQHAEDIRVERCWMVDAGHDSFTALRDCRRICVLDCVVTGAYDDGINPGGSSAGQGAMDVLIAGNYVSGIAGDGIHISWDSYNVVAVNNVVENCGAGVGFFLASNAIVENNDISSCTYGIVSPIVGQTRFPSPRLRVRNNRIEQCERGIDLVGEEIEVCNNRVTDCPIGIVLESEGGVTKGNIVVDSDSVGILINGDDEWGNEVVGNVVQGVSGGHGIRVEAGCGLVAGNTVSATQGVSILDEYRSNRVHNNVVDSTVLKPADGDVDCDEWIGILDLIGVLSAWGPCGGAAIDCRHDVNGDGIVGVLDLVVVLSEYGN